MQDELRRFANDSSRKITDLLISSNVTLMDGKPDDPGVALYFTWDEMPTCIAVDRYLTVAENLQAIYHCLAAERTKLRHGGINLVRAAFRGYAKLPPPPKVGDWRAIMNLGPNANLEAVETRYRRLRSQFHPDRGGDPREFQKLTAAIDQARKELRAEIG